MYIHSTCTCYCNTCWYYNTCNTCTCIYKWCTCIMYNNYVNSTCTYTYCSTCSIVRLITILHQAAIYNKVTIVDLILQHGGDANIKDDVSDYILFVIHM